MTEQLVNDLIVYAEANMKAIYRVQGLPEVSKSFRLVQSNSKDELFEALGFCDPRSVAPLRGHQEAKKKPAVRKFLMSAHPWASIKEE